MEENNKNTGQGMGVAALVMGIISFIVAFIPCIGMAAMFTAIIAIVLGAVGLSQATKASSPRGMMIGGLIVGVIALLVSITQLVLVIGLSENASFLGEKIEDVIKDIEHNVLDEIESGDFKIIIQDGKDKIEIESNIRLKELEDKLDELEGIDEDLINLEITIEEQDTIGGI
jgi:hypothetical protein